MPPATEEQFLTFGRYAVRVCGASSLLKYPPFPAYRSEEAPAAWDAEILLEDDPPRLRSERDGWISARDGDQVTVNYIYHGVTAFTMDYVPGLSRVTVRARRLADAHRRSGLMYGILLALSPSCLGLHGVTVRCGGETVVLSAPSGTGKTTLSRLLEAYCGAEVINGDFAMLSTEEDGVRFEPTPFCGSSGIARNERVRIDRIVFLSQGKSEVWRSLGTREALLSLSGNSFIPIWDVKRQLDVRLLIAGILPQVKTNSFAFTPTEAAAKAFMTELEKEAQERRLHPQTTRPAE